MTTTYYHTMLFNMPKITFFLRSNHDSAKTYVLYCRCTFNHSKVEFSLKEKLLQSEWNQDQQLVPGKGKKSMYVNTLIDTVKYKLKSIALVNEFLTAKELQLALHPKQQKKILLASIVKDFIAAEQNKLHPNTIRNHNVKLSNLEQFQLFTGQIYTYNFSLANAEQFKRWFQERAGTTNVTTANRNVLFYRMACLWAQKQGMIKEFELNYYRGEKDKISSPVFLDQNDISILENKTFKSKMLCQIRDLFLLQCYTGLSYADIWNDWKIKETENGMIIIGHRAKNNQAFFVPVHQSVIKLLDKYQDKLPKYTNEVYNRILKEIAVLCDIDKRITTHTARKTFATLRDSEGWSRETVSKMLGHRSIRTTEIYYLGESFSRIETEMMKRNA